VQFHSRRSIFVPAIRRHFLRLNKDRLSAAILVSKPNAAALPNRNKAVCKPNAEQISNKPNVEQLSTVPARSIVRLRHAEARAVRHLVPLATRHSVPTATLQAAGNRASLVRVRVFEADKADKYVSAVPTRDAKHALTVLPISL